MHKCKIDGCEEQIPLQRLGCKTHWHMASEATKQRVLTAWRSYNSEQCRNADTAERLRRGNNLRQAQEQWKIEVEGKLAERKQQAQPA